MVRAVKEEDESTEINRFAQNQQMVVPRPVASTPPLPMQISCSQNLSPAFLRASEFQSQLETPFHSFVKTMTKSHVSGGFWMGLPCPFCKNHLPETDSILILEDECGRNYETKYLARKTGLSGGWRRFAVESKLKAGDVILFHLVDALKLKVYIFRVNNLSVEIEDDLHQNMKATEMQVETGKSTYPTNENERNCTSSPLVIGINKKRRPVHQDSFSRALKENSEEGNGATSSESSRRNSITPINRVELPHSSCNSAQNPKPFVKAFCFTSFEEFKTAINTALVNCQLSESIYSGYYELCCSQNTFLHCHLMEHTSGAMIAGVIAKTVELAFALKTCTLSTTHDELEKLDRSLEALETLGMNVKFLRIRLHLLQSLLLHSKGRVEILRYKEACAQITRNEIENTEAELARLRKAYDDHAACIQTLKPKGETLKFEFNKAVNAPW